MIRRVLIILLSLLLGGIAFAQERSEGSYGNQSFPGGYLPLIES
jgi:hypothetical protein